MPTHLKTLPLGGRLLLALLAFEIALGLIASYAPPTAVDALVYHLAVPKLWIEKHRIVYLPSHYFSNLPFGIEMLFTLGMLTSSTALAQLIHTVFGVLLTLAIYMIARRFLSPTWSLMAAAIFYASTDVASQSSTAMVDLGLAAYILLAFWAFWFWTKTKSQSWLTVAAVSIGLAAGAKLPTAFVAAYMGILVLILTFWYHKGTFVTAIQKFATFGTISFALALPWYLKAWAFTGNPAYPFLYNIFGGKDLSPFGARLLDTGQRGPVEASPTLLGFLSLPWDLTNNPHSLGSGEIGPLFLIVAPLALALTINGRFSRFWPLAILLLGFLLLQYVTILRVRWILPAIALASVTAVITTVKWKRTSRLVFGALLATAILWLALGLVGHLRFHGSPLLPALGLETKEEYLRKTLNASRKEVSYTDFEAMNSLLPPDSRVLLLETRGYYLERRYTLGRGLVYGMMPIEDLRNPEKLYAGLKTLGITHVYQPLIVTDYETYLGDIGSLLLASGKAKEVYRSDSGLMLALSGN